MRRISGPACRPVCDGFELIRFVGFFNRSGADEIAKLFPNLFGQPSALLVPSAEPAATRPLKVGVVQGLAFSACIHQGTHIKHDASKLSVGGG